MTVPSEQILIDSSVPGFKYIGTGISGLPDTSTGWQIMRLTLTLGEVVAVKWADGDQSYDNKWSERLIKVYS